MQDPMTFPIPDDPWEGLDWARDPAASGWRTRVWMKDGYELIAYDRGDWEVRKGFVVARGKEATSHLAKYRSFRVYRALSG